MDRTAISVSLHPKLNKCPKSVWLTVYQLVGGASIFLDKSEIFLYFFLKIPVVSSLCNHLRMGQVLIKKLPSGNWPL